MKTFTKKPISYYPSVDEVINNFNFSDVREYMKQVDWKWVGFDSDGHVVRETPSIEHMKEEAYWMLQEMAYNFDGEDLWEKTGGFTAGVTAEGLFYLDFSFDYK